MRLRILRFLSLLLVVKSKRLLPLISESFDRLFSLFIILVSGHRRFFSVSTAIDEALFEHAYDVRGHKDVDKEVEAVIEAANVPKGLPVIVPRPCLHNHFIRKRQVDLDIDSACWWVVKVVDFFRFLWLDVD